MGHERPVTSTANRIAFGGSAEFSEGLFGQICRQGEFPKFIAEVSVLFFDVDFDAKSLIALLHVLGELAQQVRVVGEFRGIKIPKQNLDARLGDRTMEHVGV